MGSTEGRRHHRIGEHFVYDFVLVTGFLPAWLMLRPKILYPMGKPCLVRKDGAENRGLLVLCNHNSFLDPLAILTTFKGRRLSFVAASELFSGKLQRWFFEHLHMIEVNRQNLSMDTLRKVTHCLKDGKTVVIFPEGSVSGSNEGVRAFKSGAALMAVRGNAPILPVYIAPGKKWYNRCRVVVGQPVETSSGLSVEALGAMTEHLRQKEVELMNTIL